MPANGRRVKPICLDRPGGALVRTAALLVASLSVVACTTIGPAYREAPVAAPIEWYRLDRATGTSTAATPVDLTHWWTRFGDPALSEVIVRALDANTDLRAAQARLREVRARRELSAANTAPTVSATGRATTSRSSQETGTGRSIEVYRAGFDASWEADLFGARRRAIEAADADVDASAANLQAAQVSLVAEVALAYIDVRAFQTRLDVARRNLGAQSEIAQLTDWRAQAGLVSALESEQVRTTLEQTRAQIPALASSIAQAQDRLATLLALSTAALPRVVLETHALPAAPARVAVGIPADALRQRPDIRAAERRLAAETARIGQTAAARYPDLALSGSIGLEALTFGALGAGSAVAHSIVAGVSGILFDGGRIARQVEIQEAVRDQSAVAYEKAVLTALQEVESALAAVQHTQSRRKILDEAVVAARNAATYAAQRYRSGIVDFQSVLDTQRSLLGVEDARATSQADETAAVVRLYKALGGGWTPSAAPQLPDGKS